MIEKNTVWAIVLSTVVLVGFMLFQAKFYPSAQQSQTQSVATEQKTEENIPVKPVNTAISSEVTTITSGAETETELESTYTITTDKVNVVFTNRGGDIISYELLDHHDSDTGKGIQMADNISKVNRACSISLGSADNPIINDIFTAKMLDKYTIGFFKKFTVKNADGTDNSFTFVKQYSFKPEEYAFRLDIMIDDDNPVTGLNFGNASYTLRTSPQIGPHFDKKVDKYETRQFIAFNGEKSKKITLGEKTFKAYNKQPIAWAGIGGKYFVDLAVPVTVTKDQTGKDQIQENPEIIQDTYYSTSIEVNNYANAQAMLVRKPTTNGSVKDTYFMYFGPRNEKDLRRYNVAEKNSWGLSGLRLSESLQTSGILSWLETILKWMMEMIYRVTPNWGISIIILTILLKIILFPLTKKSSLGTLKMQELQPKMQELQKKYKDNQPKLQEETAKLYKEAGYNPVSGCLPMLLQFVVLFAMFNLFNNYFEFRGAKFISGWIPDLSVGDSIHTFKVGIPFIGNQLRILPIIYVISQLLFGKITQNGGTAAGTSATQMKIMMYGMPLFFFFIFYNAPSGLLLYWTVSNIIQMIQQIAINKIMADKKAELGLVKDRNIRQFPKSKKR